MNVYYILQDPTWKAVDPGFPSSITDTLAPLIVKGNLLQTLDKTQIGVITGITIRDGSDLLISIAKPSVVTSN